MRLADWERHWAVKHDPRKDKKPKLQYECEDCDYTTPKQSHLRKHQTGGCPRKRKRDEKEDQKKEKERERIEKNNEASKRAQQARRDKEKRDVADAKLRAIMAAEKKRREE